MRSSAHLTSRPSASPPLSCSIIVAVGIFVFIGAWNNLL